MTQLSKKYPVFLKPNDLSLQSLKYPHPTGLCPE